MAEAHDTLKAAERSVLGALLRDNLLVADVMPILKAEDFNSFAHQAFYRGVVELVMRGVSADPVTMAHWLKENKHIADIGGYDYIRELWDAAPSAGNAIHYAGIVRDRSVVRQIIRAAQGVIDEAQNADSDPSDLLGFAENAIYGVSRGLGSIRTADWAKCLSDANETLDRRSRRSGEGIDEGLKMGWPTIDLLTAGLHRQELVILAARPSVGKTLVALNIIDNVAAQGAKVFFASLEQPRTDLVFRILSRRSEVNSYKFRQGITGTWDADRVTDAQSKIQDHKLWINDANEQSLSSIVSESRRLQMQNGLDLVVIDYLGLISTNNDRRSSTRAEEVGRLTSGLKRMARDLNIPVLCLAQLNRGSEMRRGKKPELSDLRDSGSIEQDADTVFMLHKPEKKDFERKVDILTWMVEKQRNGPCGEVELEHHKKTFDVREPQTQKENTLL